MLKVRNLDNYVNDHERDAANIDHDEPERLALRIMDDVPVCQVINEQSKRHGDNKEINHQVALGIKQRQCTLLTMRS